MAEKLGITRSKLIHYVNNSEKYYKTFRIKKNSGNGFRTINAPSKQLKGIQRWLTEFLLSDIPYSSSSTAFFPGASVLKNANLHVENRILLNIDLESFFPSISMERISGILDKFGVPTTPRIAICKLVTLRGSLPQGAPSSPTIANIVCYKLDKRIEGLCKTYNVNYSRYCDDMTFSGEKCPPSFYNFIRQIIEEEGFKINEKKVWFRSKNQQQIVTGLVVNSTVAIPRQKRKNIRAIFHQAGIEPIKFKSRINELGGYIAYLKMVHPKNPSIPKYLKTLKSLGT